MAIHGVLNFDGNAAEAIEFYQGIFKGEVFKMTYADMPEDENFKVPEEKKGLIMYASITAEDAMLHFGDVLEGMEDKPVLGNNVQLIFSTSDVEKAKTVYEGLLDGGKVLMPLEKTFFSPAYGILLDRFKITWQVYVR